MSERSVVTTQPDRPARVLHLPGGVVHTFEEKDHKPRVDPVKHRGDLIDAINNASNNLKEKARLFRELLRLDPITGLQNLAGVLDKGREQLAADKRVIIFTINLSGFKKVNEDHSHGAGDNILKQFGYILANSFRSDESGLLAPEDYVAARPHGDQFIIIVSTDNSSQQIVQIMLSRINSLFNLDDIDQKVLPNSPFSEQYQQIHEILNQSQSDENDNNDTDGNQAENQTPIKLSYRVGFSDSSKHQDPKIEALCKESEVHTVSPDVEASLRILYENIEPVGGGLIYNARKRWAEIQELEKIVFSTSFGYGPLHDYALKKLIELYKEDLGINAKTGLSNRHKLLSILQTRESESEPYALGMVDLKGFGKVLNDKYGKVVGDLYLNSFAELLFSITNKKITIGRKTVNISVARTGGDEFHWVTSALTDLENISEKEIEAAVNEQIIAPIAKALSDWCRKNHIIYTVGFHHTVKLRREPKSAIPKPDSKDDNTFKGSDPPTPEEVLAWSDVYKKDKKKKDPLSGTIIPVGRISTTAAFSDARAYVGSQTPRNRPAIPGIQDPSRFYIERLLLEKTSDKK